MGRGKAAGSGNESTLNIQRRAFNVQGGRRRAGGHGQTFTRKVFWAGSLADWGRVRRGGARWGMGGADGSASRPYQQANSRRQSAVATWRKRRRRDSAPTLGPSWEGSEGWWDGTYCRGDRAGRPTIRGGSADAGDPDVGCRGRRRYGRVRERRCSGRL